MGIEMLFIGQRVRVPVTTTSSSRCSRVLSICSESVEDPVADSDMERSVRGRSKMWVSLFINLVIERWQTKRPSAKIKEVK